MPTYSTKTYRGGFYNSATNSLGQQDRVYDALDVRKPYDVIYTDGIKPDADGTAGDTLQVVPIGNLTIGVNPGFAKLGGAWFENQSQYVITLDNPIGTTRYDCVIIKNDDTEAVREPSIYIKSLNAVPTSSNLNLIRNENIYEICIGYVIIPPTLEVILSENIIDTRTSGDLCNTMSGVGATVVRTYTNTVYSERPGQTGVEIGIPQYDRTRDTLIVSVEGRVFMKDINYTIPSNTYIELTLGLPVVGTKVDFQVLKNVNASGAETVVQEVAVLREEMTAANRILEHHYFCTGVADNIQISNIINAFQTGYTDYSSMRLIVHGNFVASSPRGGSGTSDSPYYWIRSAQGSASNRRVILDFTDCKQMNFNCSSGTYNIIFFGMDTQVIGANVVASGGEAIYMFSLAGATSVYVENSRFWINCNSGGMIARSGTFKNCRASVTNNTGHSYCFAPISASLLRLDGGEYYAYTGSTSHVSAVVGLTSGTDAVAILYAVNSPVNERSGFLQTNSIYQTTGFISCTDLISTLPLNVVDGLNNTRGTISKNKPGMM